MGCHRPATQGSAICTATVYTRQWMQCAIQSRHAVHPTPYDAVVASHETATDAVQSAVVNPPNLTILCLSRASPAVVDTARKWVCLTIDALNTTLRVTWTGGIEELMLRAGEQARYKTMTWSRRINPSLMMSWTMMSSMTSYCGSSRGMECVSVRLPTNVLNSLSEKARKKDAIAMSTEMETGMLLPIPILRMLTRPLTVTLLTKALVATDKNDDGNAYCWAELPVVLGQMV